ncbi:uncharacterized protein LOC111064101 isoform X2 [Nilaparvata lugens]|uniref:uncharacterized protein LOC111064101 isoform X2 n=1 Tax=Nilaparvata lugens TaxID=108931 RepID=UPI00193D9836|nr:uncharacterized protein LOC111064101 isoform X2 [Nilaparvata lugens]
MEEPKALPNGHSDSHAEDKPDKKEIDEVEPTMKDDKKTDPKKTKSDSDEASNSPTKSKNNELEKASKNQSFENALKQIEKSAIKKKIPQKIVKRSPRISRNKEPPEKSDEPKSEDKGEKKSDDKPSENASNEEEKGSKEADEAKKEVNEVSKVSTSKKETKKEDAIDDVKKSKAKSKDSKEQIKSTGDPDADFLGFEDPKKTNYSSNRDKLKKMIDELTSSTPGSSRSRRSTAVRSDSVKSDNAKQVEAETPKATTSASSAAVKTEPEPEAAAVAEESRSRRTARPSLAAQSERKPSPTVKRNFDVTLPQYLKPFEYGWKRELAYRNNTETVSKRMADVFYYTPLGKKIRSIGAVSDYLLGTDLTLENFTFVTKSMNLNDPNKETIRDPRTNKGERPPPVIPPPTPVTTRKSSLLSKANAAESAENAEESPKTSSLSTPKISLKSFRPSPKIKGGKTPVPEKKAKKGSSDDSDNDKDELEMGMLPPLWHESIRPDWSANGSTTLNTKSGGGGGGGGEEGVDKVEVCSIRCPRMRGQVPTLACVTCLCLYHPECVNVRRTINNYVCKNCQDTNKPTKMPGPPPIHSSPPPLVPINSSQPDLSQSEASSAPATPQLQRLLDGKSVAKPQPKIVGGVTTWLPPSSMIQLTTKSTTTKSISNSSQVATVESSTPSNAQTLWQMNGKRFLYVPKHNVLSVSQADTQKQQVAQTQSGNLVSTGCVSVPSLIQNSMQSSFLASPAVSHALIVSDTANPSPTSGVLLVPCITASSSSTSSSSAPNERILLVNGGGGLPAGNFLISNLNAQQPPQQQPQTQPQAPANQPEKIGGKRPLEADKPETEAATAGDSSQPVAKRIKTEPDEEPADAAEPVASPTVPTASPTVPADPTPDKMAPESSRSVPDTLPISRPVPIASSSVSVNKDFFMNNVSAIYHALLNSFQYLKVQELLRAARVCHMWRDVAMNRSLWHVVRLKNSRVRDWEGLGAALRQTGARHLDLRKMLMPPADGGEGGSGGGDAVADMWQRYASAIDRVTSLARIDLCRCPATAVQRSASANHRLQYLSALAIKSSSLDASAFENCRNMTELRLKSSEKNGLVLENLSALKHLTKMKHLSLTTMKSFSEGLAEALENMKDLETLELGECSELTSSVATRALPKLKRLQRLRLEKGQGAACPTLAILESVKDLKSLVQLELINFDIKAGFDTTIAKCSNLRTLLIIPTYVTQSATTNHLVMEGVSKLSKTLTLFVWGITLELLRVTDLFIDQWEGQKGAAKSANQKKGAGDSIPILKPITETSSYTGAPSQVDILQLPKLHKVLTSLLKTTKVKILKVPFSATWRQTVSGPAHIH